MHAVACDLRRDRDELGAEGDAASRLYPLIAVLAVGLTAALHVLTPAMFLLFYRRENVRLTLESHDPRPAWTDRCPPRVLGLSLGLWLGAACCLPGLPYAVLPAFGVILTGPAAVAAILLLAAALVWLGLEAYRMKMSGWWGTLVLSVVLPVAGLLTLMFHDPAEIYASMGVAAGQLEGIRGSAAFGRPSAVVATAAIGALGVFYVVWIRREFAAPPGGRPTE